MSESNAPKPTPPWFSISNQVIGFCIGMAVCAAIMIYAPKNYPKITEILHGAYYMVFGAALLILIVIVGFKPYVQRFILNRAPNKARGVIEDMQNVSDHIAIQLLNLLPTPPSEDIKTRAQAILPGLTNLLIWSRLRNWWWQWILGIFVAIGGLMGTILLMNQNELLKAQNLKIDDQTVLLKAQNEVATRQMSLEEASRRSALVVLMSNIMDKVDREIEAQQPKNLYKKKVKKNRYSLSQSLIGQIVALSHSFKPYRYLEGDSLTAAALSPERGQLLITLSLLPLDTATFNRIFESSTFVAAALEGAILKDAYLSGVDLSRSDLSFADLSNADLSNADLSLADLSWTNLYSADLSNADLGSTSMHQAVLSLADLKRANLVETVLSDADLSLADLSGANLYSAVLSNAVLSGANLTDVFLRGADLHGVVLGSADLNKTDLSWANLNGVDINLHQASQVSSLYLCKALHDSIKTKIMSTRPKLFEKPEE